MYSKSIPALAGFALVAFTFSADAQSSGAAGTIDGLVTDPAGSVIPGAKVELNNPLTGYRRATMTDTSGAFHFLNIPPNPYQVAVSAIGFSVNAQDVAVRSSVPLELKFTLKLAGERTTVTVEGGGVAMLENVPYAHNDVDRELYSKLPTSGPGSGLSDAITMASPGVVADSNGFFHPLGDHAQTSFSIDGQPISDQQSKQFSTQVPLNAIQSMELITGAPGAEFGDKTSLVVNAVTRSGLGQKPFGSFAAQYGSFGSVGEEATFGLGGPKFGNFLSANALRSGRFLDSPEFRPFHDVGNSQTVFDRLDWQPDGANALHLNLLAARNWFQVPNTLDQLSQDQRQKVLTYNIAPGYQHTFGAGALLTVNAFLRRDQVSYYPSRNPFADTPATVSEYRTLANYGLRADFNYVHKIHNVKVGMQLMQTRLHERFSLGITDSSFTIDQPGLVPYDLTAGGTPFYFTGRTNVNEYAFYAQDTITLGHLTLTPGLRIDRYDGLSKATAAEPRLGAIVSLETHRHSAACRLLAHSGNAVQRKSDPLQFHRRRGSRHQHLRRLRGASNRSRAPRKSVQPWHSAIAEPLPPTGRRLLLEVYRQRLRFRYPAQHSAGVSDFVAEVQNRWRFLAPQHYADSRRASLHHDGPHPLPLLPLPPMEGWSSTRR